MNLNNPFGNTMSAPTDYDPTTDPCGFSLSGDGVIAAPGSGGSTGNTGGGGGTTTIIYGTVRAVRKSFRIGDAGSLMVAGQTVLSLGYTNVVTDSVEVFVDGPYIPETDPETFAADVSYFSTGITIVFNQGVLDKQHITISLLTQDYTPSGSGGQVFSGLVLRVPVTGELIQITGTNDGSPDLSYTLLPPETVLSEDTLQLDELTMPVFGSSDKIRITGSIDSDGNPGVNYTLLSSGSVVEI